MSLNIITVFRNNCRGNAANTSYPHRVEVHSAEDLQIAAVFDHVCAAYTDGKDKHGNIIRAHRSIDTFLQSDCLQMDSDNDHTENAAEWITPETVQADMPGVAFYAVPSRNHKKSKNGRPPRPRFHYYFPINTETDPVKYAAMKAKLQALFPYYDKKALDAARFLFGVENATAAYYPGNITVTDFLNTQPVPAADSVKANNLLPEIPQGQRNSTLSQYAGKLLKKYGNTDGKAYAAYMEYAARCTPLLPDSELSVIWNSALKFYNKTVKTAPDYLPPQDYQAQEFSDSLIPSDYTDIEQANVLAGLYRDRMKYSAATRWIVYDGQVWNENEITAQGLAQDLTERQLKEARILVSKAQAMENAAIESGDSSAQGKAKKRLKFATDYRSFVLGQRRTTRITAALNEARPKLQISVESLDFDGFLLNTPGGAVDLRTGTGRAHDPQDFCTKITAVSPGTTGEELFTEFLHHLTCNDKDLQRYLQEIAGMFLVGKVYCEYLVIAYGAGGNGKSTFFNLLARVMGNYAGSLSAETLTVNCRKNKSPEYAELRGKRLVIAAELEEGMRLDTAVVKKLCSTDPVYAEKKFKAPFSFIPSHSTVLYTNHLPKVGTTDKGTWDRLIVIPFNACFRGMEGEVMNYADSLYHHSGGAALTWMIQGAKRFITNNFKIRQPQCVLDAIEEYRAANDWLHNFLEDTCEIKPEYTEKSGELYAEYRAYCSHTGDYTRSNADFNKAMADTGFKYQKKKTGMLVIGLRITPPFTDCHGAASFDSVPPLTGRTVTGDGG